MTRAAILIGVRRAGESTPLASVYKNVHSVAAWATEQGFSPVTRLTDQDDRVRPQDVSDAVREVVEAGTTEQLVVYFAGHGLFAHQNEYWLLSEAPDVSWAAVNVASSQLLARYCGIPHVVLISDTCRRMPHTFAEQFLSGISIFPAPLDAGPERWVDMFFACGLGSPAFETPDSGLYTQSLIEALRGNVPDILEPDGVPDSPIRVVRPRGLQWHLERDVERRMAELAPGGSPTQRPDARICSPETVWLSRLAAQPGPPTDRPHRDGVGGVRRRRAYRGIPDRRAEAVTAAQDAREALDRLTRPAETANDLVRLRASPEPQVLAEARARVGRFTLTELPHDAALEVRGARIATGVSASATIDRRSGEALDVFLPAGTDVAEVVVSVGPTGGLFPVVRDFRTTLTFYQGELVDLAIEPSARSGWYAPYVARRETLRAMADLASRATRGGELTMTTTEAAWWADQIRFGDAVDPALAVLAAYEWQALNLTDRLQHARAVLREQLGLRLPDLELLGGGTIDGARPRLPLLARGWALLDIAGGLDELSVTLRPHLRASLWSLLDAAGLDLLLQAIDGSR